MNRKDLYPDKQARQADRYEYLSQTIKFYQSVLLLSMEENIDNIKRHEINIEDSKKILKELIEQTDNQKVKKLFQTKKKLKL